MIVIPDPATLEVGKLYFSDFNFLQQTQQRSLRAVKTCRGRHVSFRSFRSSLLPSRREHTMFLRRIKHLAAGFPVDLLDLRIADLERMAPR